MKSSTFGLDLSLNSLAVLFRYLVVRCGDFGLHGIDHILRQTISGFVGAFILFLAVAFVFVRLLVSFFSKDVVVMFVDCVFYVVHAAVAHFKGITVGCLVKSTGFREMFVNEIKEVSFNICFYILAIWRIIPDYISSSVSFLACRSVVVVWLCVAFIGCVYGVEIATFEGVFMEW